MEKLVAVALLVLANGFFVATEFALVSLRRSRIEEMEAAGEAIGKVLKQATHDLDRYIAGTQVGITLASLALGWIGEPALAHLLEPLLGSGPGAHAVAVAIAFAVITFLHVVIGELIPKSLALQRTEATARIVARPMKYILIPFQPLIWVLNGTGNWILRRMGLEPAAEHHLVHSVSELEILVRQSHKAGVLDELEEGILRRAFNFSEKTAVEAMVPRVEMCALDINKPLDELCRAAVDAHHARFPVYEGSLDNIIGVLYLKDLFRAKLEGITDLQPLLRPALFLPMSLHLDKVLVGVRAEQTQMAILIDEFGGTAGLLTMEDIVEEVFGELDPLDEPIRRTKEGALVVDASTGLDELNERLGWELDDDVNDTVGGYVMHHLGRVAKVGDEVPTPHGKLRVEEVEGYRIQLLRVNPA